MIRASILSILVLTQQLVASSAELAKQVEGILAGLRSDRAPGVAVLVLHDGEPIFERGYGVTDLRSLHAIDAYTNFRLASVTKQFTAMAVMLLVHDGKLRYENTLSDVFPNFPAYGKAIAIRNLLNHTSGLLDYEDLMAKPAPGVAPDKVPQIQDAEVLQLLERQRTTKFPPGTKWEYSNSGYVLLGLVVQKISGESFPDFLHQRIFEPLHMDNTIAYEAGKNEVAHRAYGHTRVGDHWEQTDQSPTSATLGDGGVYSSLSDLRQWDRALRGHILLSEAEMRPALTPVQVPDGQPAEPEGAPAAYGFGWFLNPYKGHPRMWHYGETMGFHTAIERFTGDRLTVIVLCNRTDLDAMSLALQLADAYFDGSTAP